MFERYTDRARRILVLAQEEARELGHNFIGTEHILLGLIEEKEGLAAKALTSLGVTAEAVREQVANINQPSTANTGHPPFTPRAKKTLEWALREALGLGHNYIGTEHILLGFVGYGEGVAWQALTKLDVHPQQVRSRVMAMLAGTYTVTPSAEQWRDSQQWLESVVAAWGELPSSHPARVLLRNIGHMITQTSSKPD